MARVFGKSKTEKTKSVDSEPSAQTETKNVRPKTFKRIRGLLKGESRKEKKTRKASEKAAKSAAGIGPPEDEVDDASTIFGVDVDDRSTTANLAAAAAPNFRKKTDSLLGEEEKKADEKKAYILKVVLLLMDPETRRFELLQLEFDSLKALVQDVLAQIPVSVTEEALRLQTYTGIAGKDGIEMAPNKLLANFCRGNEVLVAIPKGVPSKECARLARPILSDEKVVNMLASSGIDATGWKEDPKKKKKRSALKSPRALPETPVAEPVEEEKKAGSNKVFTVIFIVLIALLLQVFHVYISAPINPGSTISPGVWLSKCGLLTVLPSCESAYLHFSREGVVTHYNAAKQVSWKMEGSVCEVDDLGCVAGMQIQNDGKVVIGGKPVTFVTSYVKDASLSPWPFLETPKLKVWRK